MNYYPRYPADYVAKTLHLTMEQDGAYGRLMDWYYANERPVPHASRYAIARATKASERAATDAVLREYFRQAGDTWEHGRIDAEIAKAAPAIEAARANGRKGGRPRNGKPTGFLDENPVGFQNETQSEPSAKAPQSQSHTSVGENTASTGDLQGPSPAGRACLLMRQAGCGQTNPSHVELVAALAEGVTPEALADTAREGVEAGKRSPFTWAIATARSRHAEGPRALAVPRGPPASGGATSKYGKAIEDLERMKSHGHERPDFGAHATAVVRRVGGNPGG